jgi:hypothetical protein
MTLSARFSLLHSDLNDFLHASVGDEQNGMPLSVISALTRLGVDPWDEAARLAALPKAIAAEALAPMIARLSIGQSLARSDDLAVAQRLAGLLPMHEHAASPAEPANAGVTKSVHAILLLVCLALAVAILLSRL